MSELELLPRETTPAAQSCLRPSPLAETALALASDAGSERFLEAAAANATRALAVDRCLIYLRDERTGWFEGAASHDGRADAERPGAYPDLAAAVPGLETLLEADEAVELEWLTLQRGEWCRTGLGRSPLLVPVRVGDRAVGVIVLDDGSRCNLWSESDRESAMAFAALIAVAVKCERWREEADEERRVLAARIRSHQRAAAFEEELLRRGLGDGGIGETGSALATVLGLPCAVLADGLAPCSFAPDGGTEVWSPRLLSWRALENPAVSADVARLAWGRPQILGPYPELGLATRQLVVRIGSGPGIDLLVVGEENRSLRLADARLARRAAVLVSVQLRAERRAACAQSQGAESVVRDLVHGADGLGSLVRRAAAVGLDLHVPHVVCLVAAHREAEGDGEALDGEQVAALGRHAAAIAAGAVLIAALDSDRPRREAVAAVRSRVEARIAGLRRPDRGLRAAISSVCRSAAEYPRGLDECRHVLRCSSWPGLWAAGAVACADELGPAKLLLGQVEPPGVARFARDVLAPLDRQQAEGQRLLATLEAYLAANHAVRATAAGLGVHENTVRYRLRRITELTGLDVLGNVDDQLTARLAVLMSKPHSSDHVTRGIG